MGVFFSPMHILYTYVHIYIFSYTPFSSWLMHFTHTLATFVFSYTPFSFFYIHLFVLGRCISRIHSGTRAHKYSLSLSLSLSHTHTHTRTNTHTHTHTGLFLVCHGNEYQPRLGRLLPGRLKYSMHIYHILQYVHEIL